MALQCLMHRKQQKSEKGYIIQQHLRDVMMDNITFFWFLLFSICESLIVPLKCIQTTFLPLIAWVYLYSTLCIGLQNTHLSATECVSAVQGHPRSMPSPQNPPPLSAFGLEFRPFRSTGMHLRQIYGYAAGLWGPYNIGLAVVKRCRLHVRSCCHSLDNSVDLCQQLCCSRSA